MKLDQKVVGLTLGIISALWAFICVVFIAILPQPTMSFFGWLIHADRMAEIIGPRTVTLTNGIAGVIVFFILGYATGWLFAVLYNKFAKNPQ